MWRRNSNSHARRVNIVRRLANVITSITEAGERAATFSCVFLKTATQMVAFSHEHRSVRTPCQRPNRLWMLCKDRSTIAFSIHTLLPCCPRGVNCSPTIWSKSHRWQRISNVVATSRANLAKKWINAMCVPAHSAASTSDRCHQPNRATAVSSIAIKWTPHPDSSTVPACTDLPRKTSNRCERTERAKLIFVRARDAQRAEPLVHCTRFFWRSTIASPPFWLTEIQTGATQPCSWSRVVPSWPRSNTSHTTNSCQSFWANKLRTRRV